MKIIYETEPSTPPVTFGMVDEDQFFVSGGYLYQKINDFRAQMIAGRDGCPCAATDDFDEDEAIDRILPRVVRIEF